MRGPAVISIDPLRPYADTARWAAVVLAGLLVLALGYRWGSSHWRDKYAAEVRARAQESGRHAATLERLAEASAAVAERARAASDALAVSRREADTKYQEALDDAKRYERDLAAALRRGDVQLQPQWTCPATGSGTSGASADAGKAAAAGRAGSAARLAAAADADAAVIEWLWGGWLADRQAVISAGCAVESNF